jgi:hypothetical protein
MPRRKSNRQKAKASTQRKTATRPIWKGSINFGLVNIPVALYSAETNNSIDFDLLDKRDFSRVRYQRVNEKTGKEVPWDEIVKGYEYEKNEFVVLSDADFERANVEATQTIAITEFVDAAEISPVYFEQPYYLAPLKYGEKGYALLREAMRRTGKAGVARMVLRSREYLVAVLVHARDYPTQPATGRSERYRGRMWMVRRMESTPGSSTETWKTVPSRAPFGMRSGCWKCCCRPAATCCCR